MLRVVGYVRVSTDEQSVGIEVQKDIIEKFCKERDWVIEEIYEDVGVSGDVDPFKRNGFIKAFKHALNLDKRIVVYSLDRLVRRYTMLIQVTNELAKHGVVIIPVMDKYILDVSDNPIAYYSILYALGIGAELELSLIHI